VNNANSIAMVTTTGTLISNLNNGFVNSVGYAKVNSLYYSSLNTRLYAGGNMTTVNGMAYFDLYKSLKLMATNGARHLVE